MSLQESGHRCYCWAAPVSHCTVDISLHKNQARMHGFCSVETLDQVVLSSPEILRLGFGDPLLWIILRST